MNWDDLRRAAVEAAQHAHAPFSGLHVGAAGLTESGAVITGCNVESASYGLTLCAECGLISALHLAEAGALVAVTARSGDGRLLTPCGRCRQLLFENGTPDLMIDHSPDPVSISVLLPDAFHADELPAGGDS